MAATSVFTRVDPVTAALAGVMISGPVALGISGATGTARVASSATTLGCANPILSVLEDGTSILVALAAMLAPLLVPLFLVIVALTLWKIVKTVRAKTARRA